MPTLSDRNNEKAQRGLRNRADVAERVAEVRAADERRRTQPDRTQEAGLRDPAAGRRTGTQPISPSLTQRDVQRAEFRGNTEANRRMSMLTRTTSGRGFTRGQAAAIAGAPSGADFARQTIQNRLAGQTPNQSQVASEELGLRRMESDRGFALSERQDDTTRRGQDINMTGTMQGLRSQERITGDTLEAKERVAGADRESREGIVGAQIESQERVESARIQAANMRAGMSAVQAQQQAQLANDSWSRFMQGGSAEDANSVAEATAPRVAADLRASGVRVPDDLQEQVANQVARFRTKVARSDDPALQNVTPDQAQDIVTLNFALASTGDGNDNRSLREIARGLGVDPSPDAALDITDTLQRVDELITSGHASGWFGIGPARGESDGQTLRYGNLEGPAARLFSEVVQQRRQAIMQRPLGDESRQKLIGNETRQFEDALSKIDSQFRQSQVRAERSARGGGQLGDAVPLSPERQQQLQQERGELLLGLAQLNQVPNINEAPVEDLRFELERNLEILEDREPTEEVREALAQRNSRINSILHGLRGER